MKNLKKILIALAVVALLVSSVAFIVSAEGEYTGELKKLYDYYNKVDSTATASKQATSLAEAYNYMNGNPIDPDSTYDVKVGSGDEATTVTVTYAEVVAMINTKSVEIGELLVAEIGKATTADGRFTATKELLAHIAACPAEGTAGYTELLAKAAEKNAEVAAERYNLAVAATNADTKQKYVVALCEHIATYPLDATANADLIANIKALACGIAADLYTAWAEIPASHADAGFNADGTCKYCGGTETSADSTHYFNRYNGIYKAKYYIAQISLLVNNKMASGISAEESAVVKNILAGCDTMDAAMLAKQIALDAQASFDEYDYGKPYLTYDCETSLMTSYNANTDCYSHAATDLFGNKYQNIHYGAAGVHCYVEPQPGNKNAYQLGMVIEWDHLFSESFSGIEYVCREPSVGMVTPFTMNGANGVITIANSTAPNSSVNVQSVTNKIAVTSNVWTHFTLTYDDATKLGKLYVNYEYVCDLEFSNIYKFVGFRMGKTVTNQDHGYDNWTVMNGSTYRIWDKFEKMSESEKFNYYVNYMVNSENPSLSRNSAYNRAKLLYATIKNNASLAAACEASLAAYDACDYDADIKKPAMIENLGILSGKVDELLAMAVTSGNTAAVNAAIEDINTFVSVNGELINKGDTSEGGYQSLMMKVNTVKADLIKIENIVAFVDALKKFERATTYASMSKYAEAAQAVYVIAGYENADNVAFIEKDPVVLSFEATINGDTAADDEAYITLFEYYETVAEKIALRSLYENSKRIISCMNFVTSMEGYEATVEFWTANAEYISDYVNIAREIVSTGNYDASVAGIEDAVATFYALDVCFYELLQQQHIAVIEEQLAKYLATEIYIDKVGVCAVVAQYLAENDIAVYNTNMTAEVAAAVADEIAKLEDLIIVYNVYNDELASQADDYTAVLAQNTQYFINTINHMTTVLTYAELKPLFDKATGYYYSTDVNSAEAAAAAEKYIAYREQLEAYETNGAIFVGLVNGLYEAKLLEGVEREDAIYAILVDCIAYVDLVDEGVKGVASAMAAYEDALAAYNAELEIVNSDISESAKITCAVRTGSISNIVLAIVSKIFEN